MRTVVRVLAQALAMTLFLCCPLDLGWGAGRSPVRSRAEPRTSTWLPQWLPTASAQGAAATPAVKARARELYTQGQQLFRQGDFTNAQRSFEEAYRAVPNPVVLLSIAECQVRAENFEAAVTTLKHYLSEKPGAPDRSQVESQIANLEAKPGTVNIDSSPPGATIWVDGENTGYLTPNEISVHAGYHTISLAEPGYQTAEQKVEVTIGSRQRVSLTLTADAPTVVAQEPVTPANPVEEPTSYSTGRHANAGVWTSLAIAGAAGITGTALGVTALHKVKEYNRHPSKSIEDKGNRLALFADVNFGIGIVAGVTALVLYLTSGHSETPPADRAFVLTPELAPGELGMSGRMRF